MWSCAIFSRPPPKMESRFAGRDLGTTFIGQCTECCGTCCSSLLIQEEEEEASLSLPLTEVSNCLSEV